MAAQGIEFAKVLGCDAAAFVRQPVKSQSRDHVGTGAIEAQRADIGEPFDQAQDGATLATSSTICFANSRVGVKQITKGLHERGVAPFASSCSMMGKQNASVRSEEHTSELQSLMRISYDVFCQKKK